MARHFYAIRLRIWNRGWQDWEQYPGLYSVLDDGVPMNSQEKRYYHWSGPSYDTITPKPHRIEKDYGTLTDIDVLEVQFYQDFPRQVIKRDDIIPHECGYIAPNGDYYPCPPCQILLSSAVRLA